MENKIKIRPVLEGISDKNQISYVEYFQNTTLRPIIKLQHNLLIVFFKDYIVSRKTNFNSISNEKAFLFIEDVLSKDNRLKNKLLGLIIGFFTVEEFSDYLKNSSEYNKRIFGITKKRLKDSLEALRS